MHKETQSLSQPAGHQGMEAPRRLCLMLAVCGFACCSLPAVQPFCPEQCDCQQYKHILCTNRGLLEVPRAPAGDQQRILTYTLGGNFISNISASDFHGFDWLQRLDLQYNRLRSVHPQAFKQLLRLEELYLGHNLLPDLSPGSLAPLRELRVLSANDNELRRLGAGTFSGLQSLSRLRLDDNTLENLPDDLFSPLAALLTLHLKGNRIHALGERTFAGLSKLHLLDLSGNRQRTLHQPTPFTPLRSLSDLRLSNNGLEELGGGIFSPLQQLGRLWLSGNRLSRLKPGIFRGLGTLRELRLDNNQLSRVPRALLDPLTGLEVLNLSRNALVSVHPAAFARLTHLRELYLSDNALAVLSGDGLAQLTRLSHLELDRDGWTCDCQLRTLRSWLGAWHTNGHMHTVFLRCSNPPALVGQYLDYLDESQLLPPPGANGSASCDRDAPYILDLAGSPEPWVPKLPPRKRLLTARGSAKGGRHGSTWSTSTLPSTSALQLLTAQRPWSRPIFSSMAPPSLSSLFLSTPANAVMQGMSPRADSLKQARGKSRPLVSDPCEFNRLFLSNLTVVASSSMATVRWQAAEHRTPRSSGPVHFRLLYERFGQPTRFQRFVYIQESGVCTATLRELHPGVPYLVCVESVIGGRVCAVAPRDHCTGLVTPPEGPPEEGSGQEKSVEYQLLTVSLLALNLLLMLLALAGWSWRRVRRRWSRRKAPAHVRHMYSTRRPYRSVGTGVSGDFSGFQPHRPRPTVVCALSEADLMEFPCERFQDVHLPRDELLQQRFTD
ncbi:LOW QUALITY PROTEIN: TLR4 interactor with leucine rich repeats [Microcaecilia unicolor]|uniref:LOW QUALITY PROTEIN: TLR4 interactor with leucine rich repeats n=1 Tax=Microcaecilia unicolor TaxID=1415580 RepID=A0A6P7Y5F2_9AMPH|nr:LOW QUALITY PROTEIN: TLR4 interactor with leucine rich repeats [Microcaecilia unicolor]